eukprot:CAMPEP_0114236554 /NCGR_PEP_ID=MMETSP0058-20121206/6904_1 /TAXON_ID=36894 /ORGANISM="Pyramimonas parkeae, CCMP726" /LENGTH=167 /DNA_ID=CAMNT_0001348507 /DNA_START=329 /DNA_END=832 /DNA_ORIENTATION=-
MASTAQELRRHPTRSSSGTSPNAGAGPTATAEELAAQAVGGARVRASADWGLAPASQSSQGVVIEGDRSRGMVPGSRAEALIAHCTAEDLAAQAIAGAKLHSNGVEVEFVSKASKHRKPLPPPPPAVKPSPPSTPPLVAPLSTPMPQIHIQPLTPTAERVDVHKVDV